MSRAPQPPRPQQRLGSTKRQIVSLTATTMWAVFAAAALLWGLSHHTEYDLSRSYVSYDGNALNSRRYELLCYNGELSFLRKLDYITRQQAVATEDDNEDSVDLRKEYPDYPIGEHWMFHAQSARSTPHLPSSSRRRELLGLGFAWPAEIFGQADRIDTEFSRRDDVTIPIWAIVISFAIFPTLHIKRWLQHKRRTRNTGQGPLSRS